MINITVNNAVVYKVLGLYILFIGLSTGLKKKTKKKTLTWKFGSEQGWEPRD